MAPARRTSSTKSATAGQPAADSANPMAPGTPAEPSAAALAPPSAPSAGDDGQRATGQQATAEPRLPESVVAEVVVRLRRAEGQLRAVQRLLTEGADCKTVLTQLAAANRAVEQAGFRLVVAGLSWCTEHPEDAAAAGYSVEDLERLFTRIA
jgi:DNA-binding FrmR family transcriptional regulator